jgi:hypothetical protein
VPETTALGPPDPFARFWDAYPRKVGKLDALKAWEKLRAPPELIERIIAAVEAQTTSTDWLRDGGRYVPHPATWLNGRRWEDEPQQPALMANGRPIDRAPPVHGSTVSGLIGRKHLQAEGKIHR